MRLKRHLVAAGIGAAAVWFSHPTDGPRRRREARDALYRLESSARSLLDSTVGKVDDAKVLPPTPATLIEVIDAARAQGIDADVTLTGELVRCGACGHEAEPDRVGRDWMHRLEGTSDPDEMSTVSAVVCPACGARGLLVLPFGPRASAEEAAVSRRLPAPRDADMAPLESASVAV